MELASVAHAKEREFVTDYGPTEYEEEAYAYAVASYRDFHRYGLPRSGGVMKQPVVWKIALDAIADAIRHAEGDAEQYGAMIDRIE